MKSMYIKIIVNKENSFVLNDIIDITSDEQVNSKMSVRKGTPKQRNNFSVN